MPKTRDAFALQYFKEIFLNRTEYSTDFQTFFDFETKKLTYADDHNGATQEYYRTKKTVEFIEEFIGRRIKNIEKLDKAEKIREQLRAVERLLNHISKHIKRLKTTATIKEQIKEKLISEYAQISNSVNWYALNLYDYYKAALNQAAKEFSKQFGIRLRIARHLKDISQAELSSELGIAQITLSRYENGIFDPPLYTVKRLAELLNVSTDYLLGILDTPFKI